VLERVRPSPSEGRAQAPMRRPQAAHGTRSWALWWSESEDSAHSCARVCCRRPSWALWWS